MGYKPLTGDDGAWEDEEEHKGELFLNFPQTCTAGLKAQHVIQLIQMSWTEGAEKSWILNVEINSWSQIYTENTAIDTDRFFHLPCFKPISEELLMFFGHQKSWDWCFVIWVWCPGRIETLSETSLNENPDLFFFSGTEAVNESFHPGDVLFFSPFLQLFFHRIGSEMLISDIRTGELFSWLHRSQRPLWSCLFQALLLLSYSQ